MVMLKRGQSAGGGEVNGQIVPVVKIDVCSHSDNQLQVYEIMYLSVPCRFKVATDFNIPRRN